MEAEKKSGNGRYKFSAEARGTMEEWLVANAAYPYPTTAEKRELSEKTGLTMAQISNWLTYRRRKIGAPKSRVIKNYGMNKKNETKSLLSEEKTLKSSPQNKLCTKPDQSPAPNVEIASLHPLRFKIRSPENMKHGNTETASLSCHVPASSIYTCCLPPQPSLCPYSLDYCHSMHLNSPMGNPSLYGVQEPVMPVYNCNSMDPFVPTMFSANVDHQQSMQMAPVAPSNCALNPAFITVDPFMQCPPQSSQVLTQSSAPNYQSLPNSPPTFVLDYFDAGTYFQGFPSSNSSTPSPENPCKGLSYHGNPHPVPPPALPSSIHTFPNLASDLISTLTSTGCSTMEQLQNDDANKQTPKSTVVRSLTFNDFDCNFTGSATPVSEYLSPVLCLKSPENCFRPISQQSQPSTWSVSPSQGPVFDPGEAFPNSSMRFDGMRPGFTLALDNASTGSGTSFDCMKTGLPSEDASSLFAPIVPDDDNSSSLSVPSSGLPSEDASTLFAPIVPDGDNSSSSSVPSSRSHDDLDTEVAELTKIKNKTNLKYAPHQDTKDEVGEACLNLERRFATSKNYESCELQLVNQEIRKTDVQETQFVADQKNIESQIMVFDIPCESLGSQDISSAVPYSQVTYFETSALESSVYVHSAKDENILASCEVNRDNSTTVSFCTTDSTNTRMYSPKFEPHHERQSPQVNDPYWMAPTLPEKHDNVYDVMRLHEIEAAQALVDLQKNNPTPNWGYMGQ